MAHRNWCGKVCGECEHPCWVDESIPCSPDCKHLGEDGEFTKACAECDCYCEFIHEKISGATCDVLADEYAELGINVRELTPEQIDVWRKIDSRIADKLLLLNFKASSPF